ncbi:MAG TPA: DUF4446 family protein [Bacilli bacterium]
MNTNILWFIGLSGVVLILTVLLITLWMKLNKLKYNYMQAINGSTGLNIEELLIEMQQKMNGLKSISERHEQFITEFSQAMKKMKSRVGIYRYNAFETGGNDLSFSLAIIDEYEDGVVLSGIHNREESYLYAKPLAKGHSKYTLSPEEKEAINQASGMG